MAADSIVDNVAPTADVDSALPKFQIKQLLVLMAVMAVMLAATSPREIRGLDVSPAVQLTFTVAGIIFSLVASVAITIVGFGFARHRQGRPFFHEPDHWLLVTIAANQLMVLTEILLLSTIAAVQGTNSADVWKRILIVVTWLLPCAAMVILNVYIGRRKCAEARWSRVFYANAAAAMIPSSATFWCSYLWNEQFEQNDFVSRCQLVGDNRVLLCQ